jgi:multimeric flavodoxin WrbA
MLIIGLNGSPNKNGNTKYLLEQVLGKASELGAETMILDIGEMFKTLKNPFCTVCSSPCSAVCYKGTELEDIYDIVAKADGIIFGSPVYFGSMSAQLKAFFDKSRKLRNQKALYNKIAAGVTVGGSKYGGQETTMKAIHDAALIHGMIVIGDGFGDSDCGHYGVSAHKPSGNDENAKEQAASLAKRMVEVCKAAKGMGILLDKEDCCNG